MKNIPRGDAEFAETQRKTILEIAFVGIY